MGKITGTNNGTTAHILHDDFTNEQNYRANIDGVRMPTFSLKTKSDRIQQCYTGGVNCFTSNHDGGGGPGRAEFGGTTTKLTHTQMMKKLIAAGNTDAKRIIPHDSASYMINTGEVMSYEELESALKEAGNAEKNRRG